MPKLTRKQRQSPAKAPTKQAPRAAAKAPEPPAAVERKITERVRVRCPVCGMLPEDFRIERGPYNLEVKMQQFGGDRYMKYEERPDLIEDWKPTLIQKIRAALQLLGGG